MLDRVFSTIDSRQHQSLSLLKEFLTIPSVSTKPEHQPDMQRCAMWLADQCRFAALDVSVMPTTRDDSAPPIVVAKNKHQPDRPTALIYGHYDVQPPEPLELWQTPPFQPTIRDGKLFARGSADDKGQVWAHLEALLAWQAHGGPPINITLLIEGEEEIGSDHLESFMAHHRDALQADVCVISDSNQFATGIPAITYGLRGLCYMEVFLTGPGHDLHSGLYGGSVPNPANVMGELIGTLHTSDGRVNLPGFYDEVLPLTQRERDMWKQLPFDEREFTDSLGLSDVFGEAGFTTLERQWARPTCDVNGITAGYQGSGAKTVIPSKASAKISMRLVPNQDPAKIQSLFEKAVRDRLPANVQVEFKQHGLSAPVLVPIDGKPTSAAAAALKIGFGADPVFMRGGGSIPVVGLMKKVLGIDTLLFGLGLPDDRPHSPNEKFDLSCLHGGTRAAAALYQELSGI